MALMRPHLENLEQNKCFKTGDSPVKSPKMVQDMGHMMHRKRLQELGIFSLKMKRPKEAPIANSCYLMGKL